MKLTAVLFSSKIVGNRLQLVVHDRNLPSNYNGIFCLLPKYCHRRKKTFDPDFRCNPLRSGQPTFTGFLSSKIDIRTKLFCGKICHHHFRLFYSRTFHYNPDKRKDRGSHQTVKDLDTFHIHFSFKKSCFSEWKNMNQLDLNHSYKKDWYNRAVFFNLGSSEPRGSANSLLGSLKML